jgi:pyruvate dehydrogenase E2 component (dihydrolipoamide acetyltransferase)
MEFRLPPLGEGIDTATVTAVLVRPGDIVQPGQNVLTVETDKAAVEVPIDVAGQVESVLVQPGEKIPIDAVVLRLRSTTSPKPQKSPPSSSPASSTSQSRASSEAGTVALSSEAPAADHAGATPPTALATDLLLPELGEGIESAIVSAVLVQPGDLVQPGQNVLTVETDKAAVEIPADRAGVVETIYVQPGDRISVGTRIVRLGSPQTERGSTTSKTERLVEATATAPLTTSSATAPTLATASHDRDGQSMALNNNGYNRLSTVLNQPSDHNLIPASPAARRLARELGVSLAEIPPSGRGGRVTLEDIKNFVRNERQRTKETPAGPSPTSSSLVSPAPLPDFGKYGPIEIQPASTLRQTIARNLTVAWQTIPMVTQHDVADITELEAGRKRFNEAAPPGAAKITMTVLAIKAVVAALKEFPQFNSSYDTHAGRLIFKRYYHIGLAVDTRVGLIVPVVRDADKKSIRELAAEVQILADKARSRKLSVDDLRGSTFTISNLGGIGGTAFTPIVNYPEVAILGLSRSTWQPVVRDGQITPRLLLPLSLTYDHRVIDGADGCRFLVRLAQLLSDPIRWLMES